MTLLYGAETSADSRKPLSITVTLILSPMPGKTFRGFWLRSKD